MFLDSKPYEIVGFYLFIFRSSSKSSSNIMHVNLMLFYSHFPSDINVHVFRIFFFFRSLCLCFFFANINVGSSVGKSIWIANRLTEWVCASESLKIVRSLRIYFIFQFSEFSLMLQLLSNFFLFGSLMFAVVCEISISISSVLWLFSSHSLCHSCSASLPSFYHICLSRLL